MEIYITTFVISLLASLIQGATSFGFAIFAMAVLPFFVPFKTAAVLVLLLSMLSSWQNAFKNRRFINLKLVLPVLLTSFVGRTIGIKALVTLNTDILKMLLGITLIAFSIYFVAFNGRISIKPSTTNGAIAGIISGIIGGMFNTGGPPLVVYYFSALEDRKEYIANLHTTFALSSLYSLILHLAYGNMSLEILKISLVSAVAIPVGGMIGLYFFNKFNKSLLSKVIYTYMAIAGILLIIKI